jgi:hypothetical protein
MEITLTAGDYSVAVLATSIRRVSINSIAIPHQTEYSLRLTNNSDTDCDAVVTIDGRPVGTFRVLQYSQSVIERPASEHRKFLFLKEHSYEAEMAGVRSGRLANGLVTVIFNPEKRETVWRGPCGLTGPSGPVTFTKSHGQVGNEFYSLSTNSADFSTSAGATVLGDHSNQEYNTVRSLNKIDHTRGQTIQFRLVVDDTHVERDTYDDWPRTAYPQRPWDSVPHAFPHAFPHMFPPAFPSTPVSPFSDSAEISFK